MQLVRSVSRGLLIACAILLLLPPWLHTPLTAGELPGEEVLPGDKVPATDITPRRAELPTESVLPGELPSAAGADTVAQPQSPPVLPSESLLPADGAAPVAEPPTTIDQLVQAGDTESPPELELAAPAQPAEIGARPQGQPWLRFNVAGHTAPIRALTFVPGTDLLCSAGEDKEVHVWSPLADNGNDAQGPTKWTRRTIRWQVQRGARGRVYALAASPDSLAMAGHGAMGMLGEIILVDPVTGQFQRALTAEEGHRQVIASLSFSPTGNELASLDVAGHAAVWSRDAATGQWKFVDLTPPDTTRYGAAEASKLASSRRTAPVIVAGQNLVVQPVFKEWKTFPGQPQAHAAWQLERIDVNTKKSSLLTADQPHYGMVSALAVSPDSRLLASADAFGQLFLWDLTSGKVVHRGQMKAVAVSLAFDQTGKKLLAGTARSPLLENKAQIEIYDLTNPAQPKVAYSKPLMSDCYAAVSKPGDGVFAYAQSSEIKLAKWAQPAAESTIEAAAIRPIYRVAFAREKPFYRIAVSTVQNEQGKSPLEMTYDLGLLQLGRDAEIPDRGWLTGDTWKRNFQLKPLSANDYQVTEGDAALCTIRLRSEFHGAASATCWIPDRTGKPAAVAIGTSSRGDIYIYQITPQGAAPLMRHFRGHGGQVNSLCVSRDLKYLVSGSSDATACIWPLADYANADRVLNNWGAQLEVAEGAVTVSSIRADGPLYHRGMREGDTIGAIAWHNGTEVVKVDQPNALVKALAETPADQLVMFEYRRGRMQQEAFQIFPAWNPLSLLAISSEREWAYWTPAGYYDASFDGHKMFGWQINRGLANPPEFFLAAQFRKALEKPEVMEQLLEAGSLEAALKLAEEAPAVEGAEAIISQLRSAPKIEITGPVEGTAVKGGVATITAAISVRRGVQLARVKAFANGVTAGEAKQLGAESIPGGTKYTYEFTARLPSEPKLAIDVIAATDAQTADFARVTVDHTDMPSAAGKGRMFVFSAGINSYRDGQIPPLDFAVNNARKVAELFKDQSDSLYNAETMTLTNASVTRPMWQIVAQQYADSLRERVSPDDVLVLFLSGHGLRDQATDQYYYVGADADYAEIQTRQFAGCISQDDFGIFADIPCRKLVILDTCHSGAVQSNLRNPELKQRDLKSAVRALQSDMMLTITASEGHEEAFEEKTREHGLFTSRLLEALAGAADQQAFGGDGNGQVTLPETIAYVQTMVETDSAAEGLTQHPTAGPHDLLPLVQLPLTAARGE